MLHQWYVIGSFAVLVSTISVFQWFLYTASMYFLGTNAVMVSSMGIPLVPLLCCSNGISLVPLLLSLLLLVFHRILHTALMIFHWVLCCYYSFYWYSIGSFLLHQWYSIRSFVVIVPTIGISMVQTFCIKGIPLVYH